MREAAYYSRIDDEIRCLLCPHSCRIRDGETGICLARRRIGDKLYAENYGRLSAVHLDPIEKKPLNRYKSGSYILSVGSYGCNLKCGFCQNHDISQNIVRCGLVPPEELVEKAYRIKNAGNIGIAYTYNEPTVMYEYVFDTAKLLKEKYGMDNILVTNGYINEGPLGELLGYIDAANVDLKSSDPSFYKNLCKGDLDTVEKNLSIFHENCHLEVTNLLIGGYNDGDEQIEDLCRFIASISRDIPLHLSRFYPAYRFANEAPTPVYSMYKAKAIADRYLNCVYLGNMP